MLVLAQRESQKIRIALQGPEWTGKTLSSLLLAYGIVKDWRKILVIDTEGKSSNMYIGKEVDGIKIEPFYQVSVEAPYHPKKLIEALEEGKKAGIEVFIIDSLSHFWSKPGGMLAIAEANGGITGGGWKTVNQWEEKIQNILNDRKSYYIVTMRTDNDYAIDKDPTTGRTRIQKLGLKPVQRKDINYEYDVVLSMSGNGMYQMYKDRTGIFNEKVPVVNVYAGECVKEWSEEGNSPIDVIRQYIKDAVSIDELTKLFESYHEIRDNEGGLKDEISKRREELA